MAGNDMDYRRNVLEEKGAEKECKTELPADWAVSRRSPVG
ncbi:hypothetical protein GCM10010301_73370 [Streptomyces plicatus]|nr:hypothetical protein GCM10010301_73370 [Streptomyces plicatus]